MNLNSNYFRIIIFTSLCAVFLIHSSRLFSQIEDEDVTRQAWLDYNANYQLSNNFNIYGDAGPRFISPNIWTRFYFRPAISFTPNSSKQPDQESRSTFHAGLGFFYTNNHNIPNHLEIRPFLGYQFQWPTFVFLQFSHYVRLEERIEYYSQDWDFGLRFRYMLSGELHWNKKEWDVISKFYFPFHVEFFFNIATHNLFNDLVRITPGLGYTFSPKWKVELSASYHRTRIDVGNPFETNDIVFRLRVFHDIFHVNK